MVEIEFLIYNIIQYCIIQPTVPTKNPKNLIRRQEGSAFQSRDDMGHLCSHRGSGGFGGCVGTMKHLDPKHHELWEAQRRFSKMTIRIEQTIHIARPN